MKIETYRGWGREGSLMLRVSLFAGPLEIRRNAILATEFGASAAGNDSQLLSPSLYFPHKHMKMYANLNQS